MSDEPQKEVCETCLGDKELIIQVFEMPYRDYRVVGIKCPTCGGTGRKQHD